MAQTTDDLSSKLTQKEYCNGASQIMTPSPSHSEGETSPIPDDNEGQPVNTISQKKKKKRKPKKSVKAKEAAALAAKTKDDVDSNRPPVLCISRNKHWRYISSYHVRDCFIVRFFPSQLNSIHDNRAHGSNFPSSF